MATRPFGMTGKIVDVDGDSVIVHHISRPRSNYTRVFQNSGTRELDARFGLTGARVGFASELENSIQYSVREGVFGSGSTQRVLEYFGTLALQGGIFVGIPEDEFRTYLGVVGVASQQKSRDFFTNTLDAALEHNAGLDQPYLRRINVDGTDVIFPANIGKLG